MKPLWIFLLLIAASCTLSADQELSLNDAMTHYLSARNNMEVLNHVAMTHGKVVKHYKNLGDEAFKRKFGQENEDYFCFIQDGNIRDTESDGNKLQVKYSFLKISGDSFAENSEEIFIYAISEDNGLSWTFVDQEDYLNDDIFTDIMRLIK